MLREYAFIIPCSVSEPSFLLESLGYLLAM